MPAWSQIVAFSVASIILIEIPGPSLLFAIGRALTVGRREAVMSVIGNAIGVLVQLVAVGIGLGALLAASSAAFTVVKLVGAAYVVWLGIQAIWHRGDARRQLAELQVTRAGDWSAMRSGVVVGITNPKTLVFFGAFLPQFLSDNLPVATQLAVYAPLFAVLAVASDVVWVLAASRAKKWFASKPQRLDAMSVAGGTMMIALGGVLATTDA